MQVPFIFKYAVDGLAATSGGDPLMSTSVLALTPAALLVGYGVARVTAVGCNELRNAVFAKVWPLQHDSQSAHIVCLLAALTRTPVVLPLHLQELPQTESQSPFHNG